MAISVLIVDADEALRELLRSTFAGRGWEVVEAGSLAAAREVLQVRSVEVLMTDSVLPDGDGVELLAEAKAMADPPKVAYMSAGVSHLSSYRSLTKDLGVSFVVRKPLVPAEIVVQVAGLFDEERAGPAVAFVEVDPGADETASRLVALRAGYLDRLREKLAVLASNLRSMGSSAEGDPRLDAALNEAHRLHGTAGTYGFPNVGREVGRIETLLLELRARPHVDWGGICERVAGDLEDLRGRLERGADEQVHGSEADESQGDVFSATVLFVHPEAMTRERFVRAGRDKLIRVLACPDEGSAVQFARSNWIDGAVIATNLEVGSDAFRLSERLRDLPGCDDLGVALVSPAPRLDVRLAAVRADATLHLSSPLEVDDFVQAVEHLSGLRDARRPKVLVVEDDDDFARELCARLATRGISGIHLADATGLLEALEEERPDLVLTDLVMPSVSGFDVCRLLRASPQWRDLPLVVITARIGADVRTAVFRAGADDYVAKPLVDEELAARIWLRLERAQLHNERNQRDPVTGLLLRSAFSSRLSQRLAELRRHGEVMALALLDVDRFKEVNDLRGHLTGDRVLASLGRQLRQQMRTEDLSCRWGGEELALVFFGETAEQARKAVERILASFQKTDFSGSIGETFSVSFSAGIATLGIDGRSLDELVAVADQRLHRAKSAGRARVVI